jgi:hypothetical protein
MGKRLGPERRGRGSAGSRGRWWPWLALTMGALLALLVASTAQGVQGPPVGPPQGPPQAPPQVVQSNPFPGIDGGAVSAQGTVTRQELARMLVQALQLPVSPQDRCPFTDVDLSPGSSLYPDHYVAVAAGTGLMRGFTLTLFVPGQPVTRAQVLVAAIRAATPSSSYSSDRETAALLKEADDRGLTRGLPGFGPRWDPWATATRGEVTQVLENLAPLVRPRR